MIRALLLMFAALAVTTLATGLNRGGPTDSPDALPLALALAFLTVVALWISALGRAGGRRR